MLACALVVASTPARAEPLRLRADALVQSRAPAPVGLVALEGQDRLAPWLDAETSTWLGATSSPDVTGDVLTLSVRARDVKSGSEVRGGRMVVTMGAIRPHHVDGVRGSARVFDGTSVEAFAGVPVARRFDYRAFAWVVGGRAGQRVGDVAAFGASYLHRRVDGGGARADEEVGADLGFAPSPTVSAAGRLAYDVVGRGVTDALASLGAATRDRSVRAEVFATHRTPGRLLPSTSLFSVLGDFAATTGGATVTARAFPRLELLGTASAQGRHGELGGQGTARATLALDDGFAGTLAAELRRVHVGDARWTGARGLASLPVARRWRVATELELVVPDRPRGRAAVWPWALAALGFRPADGWDVAAGVEAAGGGERGAAVYALGRVTWTFERPVSSGAPSGGAP